ncbi:helix-turn-helix domain-containing protein [Paenibacillus sp. MBLB4367]|uniref:helix-turn-helix domain-containing protein n=1 Tax=Paenibacillus sp. MBLB4367 TaxID=3384767 RepID=UPI003908327E
MLHRVRSFTRHKHFFMRLLTFTLLICLVPIGVLGFFFYHNVQNSMRHDIEQANELYLNQTVNAMELVVKQIGNGFRQFVTNNTLTEFDMFPLGNYFEEIGAWHTSSNREQLLEYMASKAKVLRSMNDLLKLNEFICSVYYINPARGIVLTSGYLQYEIDKFYDSDWDKSLKPSALGYPLILNVRSAMQEDGTLKRVVPVVFRPLASNYTIVINLDANAFYTNLISRLGVEHGTSVMVFSREGEPLLYDNDASKADGLTFVQSILASQDEAGGGSLKSHKVVAERQLVSWRNSEVLGWDIANVTNLHTLYRNVSNIRNLFYTVSILLTVATAILAVVTSRRIYRPVNHLLQFVKDGSQGVSRGLEGRRPRGEFRVISDGLADAYATERRLRLRLRESLPAYQEKFLRSLLKKHGLQPKAVEERFDYLGIGLKTHGIVPMLVSVDNGGRAAASIESEQIEQLLVTHSIDSAVDEEFAHWVLEMEDDVYLVLVNCAEHEMSAVFSIAEAIKDSIAERHGMPCTIGIGTYGRTIGDLPQAYQEAEEALQYRGMTADSDIVYIEDVRLHAHEPLPYPKDRESTFIVCLKNGDKDQALAVFAEMVRDMRDKAGKVAFPHVQQTFLLLLVKLIETVRDLHLDMREIVPGERSHLLAVFLQKDDWRSMTAWFESLISATAAYIGQAFREKKNTHVEHAKRLIQSESASTVSLTSIAEKLNLNPAYLSRIFKEYTGVTFTDYVIQARLRRSKELLLQTELKVQDISEQLGYAKVNHFIKLFKDMTGITPGEFRKQHF